MRRRISFILAAVMLICNMAISAFAAEQKSVTFSDVNASTKYSEAIQTLVSLGIINGYEDGTFKPEGEITRAEFSKIITVAMGIASGSEGNSNFTDVDGHWAVNNIAAATAYGITNGFEDGTFRPDDKVTYEQCVKMIVCALGYEISAQAAGGWPTGYQQQGTVLGLTKNVGAENAYVNPAPRGLVAQLMYNALEVKVANEKTSIATDTTFLSKFMGMEKLSGKIVGIEDDVTAECTQALSNDEMAVMNTRTKEITIIDFSTLFDSSEDVKKYLGHEALVFYKVGKSGGLNQLVSLNSEVKGNDVTVVSSDDFSDYSNGVLEYYNEKGKRTKITFDTSKVTVYYNKKAVTSNVASKLSNWFDSSDETNCIYGDVTLTDSGDDGTVDMIEIMDYETMVAARSASDYTITNKMKFTDSTKAVKNRASVTLNPDKNAYSFTITDEKGASVETNRIAANNVLLVAESENADHYTVKLSTTKVSGSVEFYSEDEKIVKVAGKEYDITSNCINYLKDQQTELTTESSGEFYLDANGKIAYAVLKAVSDNSVLAYIVNATYDESNPDVATIKAFVPGKGNVTYSVDKKVRMNGSSYDPSEVAMELLDKNGTKSEFDADGKDWYGSSTVTDSRANQLARLEVSGASITKIVTLDTTSTGTNKDTSKIVRYKAPAEAKYVGTNQFTYTGGSKENLYTNSSTTFIVVPADRNETKSYAKRTTSGFSSGTNYVIDAFNVDDSNVASIVLVYIGKGSANTVADTTAMSFMATNPSTDASGDEVVQKMTVFTSYDNATSILVDEDEDVSSMVAGDIFQYVKGGDGRAVDIHVRIKYSDIKAQLDAKTYDWTAAKFKYETNKANRTDNSTGKYGTTNLYNVVEVTDAGIIVTKEGFVDGKLPDNAETTIIITDTNTKYLKMSSNGRELLNKDEDSEAAFTIDDLVEAKYEDDACSKIAVTTLATEKAKAIVIYE